MRINGFEQIKSFYSWTFSNQDKRIKPHHISLYLFLINQNNRNNWVEWFKCPFDLGMAGSGISSKKTYYNCLNDLVTWNLIQYKKGANNWKSPLIKLEVLKCTSTVPQSEPLTIPLIPPLPPHIYKLITNNRKLIIENLEDWLKVDVKNKEDNIPKFTNWFNEKKLQHLKVKGRCRTLSKTDLNNLKKLKQSYSTADFDHAFQAMTKSKWAKENNMITPAHFLRHENFVKYLNTEINETKSLKELLRG